jgi:regulator of protease activity HflC (stomatin/prohibitin superfamily)
MPGMTLLVLVPLAIMTLLVLRSIVFVPIGFAYVTERRGQRLVLQAGLHLSPPFLTRVSAKIPLTDQTVDVPAVACTTQDGAASTLGGAVVFKIVDPAKAVSNVADVRTEIVKLMSTTWTGAVAAHPLLEALMAVKEAHYPLKKTLAAWGVEIVKALPEMKLSDQAMQALEAQAAEERSARVAAWVTERKQRLGPDGRPTPEQVAAYGEWLALERRIHQKELEAAQRVYEKELETARRAKET